MAVKKSTPARRVTAKQRADAGRHAVALYNEGKSVREVKTALGWSYGATHRLLTEYGVVMRPRGNGIHKDGRS